MSSGPLFTREQLETLLSEQSITPLHPWASNDEEEVTRFYRGVCEHLARALGAEVQIMADHYGSGTASFVDAWFYRTTPDFVPDPPPRSGESYVGLAVILSRFAPYYVLMQGEKSWYEGGAGLYQPYYDAVDRFSRDAVSGFIPEAESILHGYGLQRLHREELGNHIPPELQVPTILGEPPYTEFDALFYWED